MANRYWVGTGTWDATSTANWSNVSGGAGGFSVPTSADAVFINLANTNCTIATGYDPLVLSLNFTAGNLFLNNSSVTTTNLICSSYTTRTIDFGTSGEINLTGNNSLICNVVSGNSLTSVGSRTLNLSYSGSTGVRTVAVGNIASIANVSVFNINVTNGADTVKFIGNIGDIDFTGFSGTFDRTNGVNCFGNLTFSSTMTLPAQTWQVFMAATSGNYTITTNGKAVPFPIYIGASSSTANYTLADDLNMGSVSAGSPIQFNAGNLNLNNNVMSVGAFSSMGSTRKLNFGSSGALVITGGGAASVVWSMSAATGITYEGNANITLTYTGSAGTRYIRSGQSSGGSVTTAPPVLTFLGGSDNLILEGHFNEVNLSGWTGTLLANTRTMYRDFIIPANITAITGGSNTTTFSGNANQIFDTNNITIGCPISVAKSGGNIVFANSVTMGAARAFTMSGGNLTTLGNITSGSFSTSGTGAKTIFMGNSTWNILSTKAMWTIGGSNISIDPGTSTVVLGPIANNTRELNTGNQSFNNVVIQTNGANTTTTFLTNTVFNSLTTDTAYPMIVDFKSGNTFTFNNFNLSGPDSSNLVTITSNGAGTATLVYSGLSSVNISNANIINSAASPADTWYSLLSNNNIDGGNNTGWIFTNVTNYSNFFLLF